MATAEVLRVQDVPSTDLGPIEIDFEALTAKYEAERQKRVKKKGIEQYQHATTNSNLREMTDDPFVEPGFTRDPVTAEHDVVIVGGGTGGLIMACHLVKAGITNIRIIERAGDFGGSW